MVFTEIHPTWRRWQGSTTYTLAKDHLRQLLALSATKGEELNGCAHLRHSSDFRAMHERKPGMWLLSNNEECGSVKAYELCGMAQCFPGI